jgi:ADP-heptose:LPS heptosyltransferase
MAVLVIKHSALGDILLASGCFKAIRDHHPDAQIVLLTTQPFVELARSSGFFDIVVVDRRPKLWQPGLWRQLLRLLRGFHFTRVYDLHRKQRTRWLYRLLRWGRPDLEWSGVVPGCSHYQPDPRDDERHIVDKLNEQLRIAGIPHVPDPDLSWLGGGVVVARAPRPFVLMAPGAAASRPEKKAPAALYGAVAHQLVARGITPVLIGRGTDAADLATVAAACPRALNFCDQTSLDDVADLARSAMGAVGNDTGPMHLIGLAGCPTVTLFSHASNPRLVGPRGPAAMVLQREDLAELTPNEVLAALEAVWRTDDIPAAQELA